MDEITKKAINALEEMKDVTFANIDDEGLPSARIIDVMYVDDDGIYFCTARGKPFFKQLKADPTVAICGMDKKYVSVRIVGEVQLCNDRDVIDKIIKLNPGMNEVYPGERRNVLEGFRLYKGKGEIFDLSIVPPLRQRFSFGGTQVSPSGNRITDDCTACGLCLDACPMGIITEGDIYQIDRSRCLECGSCEEICPDNAVESAKGL